MRAMLPARRAVQSASPARPLTVNRPGDRFEQEADRIAGEIVSGMSPSLPPIVARSPGTIQRKCRQCEQEEEEQGEMIRAKELPGRVPSVTPDLAARLTAPQEGRPLPSGLRAAFEPRLGRELDGVRLHADGFAARAAHELGARAFTLGRDVFFGEGELRPRTTEGLRLIAHELAHVAQQGAAPPRQAASRSAPGVPAIQPVSRPQIQRAPCAESNRDQGGTGQLLIQHWLKKHGAAATGGTWYKEVEIPGGSLTTDAHGTHATGYADLVWDDGNDAHIFELKKTGALGDAADQVARYRQQFAYHCAGTGNHGAGPFPFAGRTTRRGTNLGVMEFPGTDNETYVDAAPAGASPGVIQYSYIDLATAAAIGGDPNVSGKPASERSAFRTTIEGNIPALANATIADATLNAGLPGGGAATAATASAFWNWLLRRP